MFFTPWKYCVECTLSDCKISFIKHFLGSLCTQKSWQDLYVCIGRAHGKQQWRNCFSSESLVSSLCSSVISSYKYADSCHPAFAGSLLLSGTSSGFGLHTSPCIQGLNSPITDHHCLLHQGNYDCVLCFAVVSENIHSASLLPFQDIFKYDLPWLVLVRHFMIWEIMCIPQSGQPEIFEFDKVGTGLPRVK